MLPTRQSLQISRHRQTERGWKRYSRQMEMNTKPGYHIYIRPNRFLGSKITADGDCSHEIKRCLLLGRKVMTNLDGLLKSRDITLPTKVRLVKAMIFPVVMYGCESWTVKKVECQELMLFNCVVWDDS